MKIKVHNIKCGGCMTTINKALKEIEGVEEITITDDKETIEITGAANREQVVEKLAKLGYPEKGNNNLLHKTKSFVSCALGRMAQD
jgi:copper chaperone CopZ